MLKLPQFPGQLREGAAPIHCAGPLCPLVIRAAMSAVGRNVPDGTAYKAVAQRLPLDEGLSTIVGAAANEDGPQLLALVRVGATVNCELNAWQVLCLLDSAQSGRNCFDDAFIAGVV